MIRIPYGSISAFLQLIADLKLAARDYSVTTYGDGDEVFNFFSDSDHRSVLDALDCTSIKYIIV